MWFSYVVSHNNICGLRDGFVIDIPWKQKTGGFWMFSGGIEVSIGWKWVNDVLRIYQFYSSLIVIYFLLFIKKVCVSRSVVFYLLSYTHFIYTPKICYEDYLERRQIWNLNWLYWESRCMKICFTKQWKSGIQSISNYKI